MIAAAAVPPPKGEWPRKSFKELISASPSSAPLPIKPLGSYKGEPSLTIDDNELSALEAPWKLSLVGKFAQRGKPLESLRKDFQRLQFKGSYWIGSLDPKHVLIRFDLEEDFCRFWRKGLWIFGGNRMRVFKWTFDFDPLVESSIVPIWIRLEGLPIHLFNKACLFSLAKAAGEPLVLDEPTARVTRPSVARICVEVDLLAPLCRRVWIAHARTGKGFWQTIEYEDLPDYCSSCWKIGHSNENCAKSTNNNNNSSSTKAAVSNPRIDVIAPIKVPQRTDRGKAVFVEPRTDVIAPIKIRTDRRKMVTVEPRGDKVWILKSGKKVSFHHDSNGAANLGETSVVSGTSEPESSLLVGDQIPLGPILVTEDRMVTESASVEEGLIEDALDQEPAQVVMVEQIIQEEGATDHEWTPTTEVTEDISIKLGESELTPLPSRMIYHDDSTVLMGTKAIENTERKTRTTSSKIQAQPVERAGWADFRKFSDGLGIAPVFSANERDKSLALVELVSQEIVGPLALTVWQPPEPPSQQLAKCTKNKTVPDGDIRTSARLAQKGRKHYHL